MNSSGPWNIDLERIGQPIACLTLDLEQDYGHLGHFMEKPSYEAFSAIDPLFDYLKQNELPLTCFVQSSLFETHPDMIDRIKRYDIEFELHTYSHPPPQTIDHEFEIRKGWEVYTDFFGKNPIGYRSPSGMISDEIFSILPDFDFKFDSSVVPSYRPGVYNSLDKPVLPYYMGNYNVMEFPVTVVSNILRVPISLSYQKFFGTFYQQLVSRTTLPRLIVFSFHLHDLVFTDAVDKIPADILSKIIYSKMYKSSGGMRILDNFVSSLTKRGYRFDKMKNVYDLLR